MSVSQQPETGDGDSGDERDFPLSDAPLLDLLDALVGQRGKVAASQALGVNYRTMMACYDSRRVSRRMRRALEEFLDAGETGGAEVDGDGAADEVETLRQRVAELEEEARGLRGLVETQASQLEELGRRVAHLVREAQQRGESEPVVGQDQLSVWRPPRREHGLPDAGVVTLEEQPDEKDAFGPAAPLVAEWRAFRLHDATPASRVDRARAGDAPVGVGDGVAAGLSPDVAAGDGADGRSEKGGSSPVATKRFGGDPRGTGRSEAGAPPATHIHPWPVVEVGPVHW